MTKDEARSSVMGAISMALKDPTLQQGFEIICKNISELEKENNKLESRNGNLVKMYNEVVERQNSLQQSLYKNLAEPL